MMKSLHLTILAAALMCSLTCGCDAFRSLAGRPTTKEILAKAERMQADEQAHRARIDSLRRVEKQLADSLAILDSLRTAKESLISTRQLAGGGKYDIPYRYYVMIGSFSSKDNATRQAARAQEAGYPATLIPFRNGFTAVGCCPSDDLTEVYASLQKLRTEEFCPADAWILNNE